MAATDKARLTPVSDEKPTDAVVQEILRREVQDQDGKAHSLGSLITDGGGTAPRTVVVFIRHFYCSFCQEYVRSLTRDLPPSKLSALEPSTKLIIIGHGEASLIKDYSKQTDSAFPIFADSSRVIYDKLGFVSNLKGVFSGSKPDYIRKGMLSLAIETIRGYAFGGSKMFSSGKVDQNGGEVIFTGGKVDFISRMKNTSDHTEPNNLEAILTA